MATVKKGYKVSYEQILDSGNKKHVTAITYPTKEAAKKYAKQLNDGHRFKNARVRKA